MTSVVTKLSDRIHLVDIHSLISEAVPEGAQVEFKESLPVGKGGTDPWVGGEDRVGDRGRNRILEEVVAFANAFGGTLILGVAETEDKPAVAAGVSPLPRCVELAGRFRMMFRDCVDPQLPSLDIQPVPTDGQDGVIVFRAGRSLYGPHRVTPTRVCPIRRADRCEELDMREIQDMTLNLARGTERLERRLNERAAGFEKEFEHLGTPSDAFGFRLTAVPVGDEFRLDSVWWDGKLIEELRPPAVKVRRTVNSRVQELETIQDLGTDWRPLLRMARTEKSRGFDRGIDWMAYAEAHADGLLEYGFVRSRCIKVYGDERETWLDTDTPVSMLGRILAWTDRARLRANAPGVEYAIQVQFRVTAVRVSAESPQSSLFRDVATIDRDDRIFPLYPLGAADDLNGIVSLFERDFWNYLGEDIAPVQGLLEIVDA